MKKDYSSWVKVKEIIEKSKRRIYFKEGEIWWCSIGSNIGHEEEGKNKRFERPILIFRKFNKELFWGIPLTSKAKRGIFYRSFKLKNRKSTVILTQLRVLSVKRLIRRMGRIRLTEFRKIEEDIISLIKTDPLRGPQVP